MMNFDLSKDVLSKIDPKSEAELCCYTLDDINEVNWIDIESPMYAERNKKIVDKIIFKMNSFEQG